MYVYKALTNNTFELRINSFDLLLHVFLCVMHLVEILFLYTEWFLRPSFYAF